MAVVGLTVSGGRLFLSGQRFRNIGVKWPTAIVNFFDQPASTTTAGSCVYTSAAVQNAGLDYLQALGVRCILVPAILKSANERMAVATW